MEENREFPKKQLLSLQLDLSKFDQVSEEEKAQAVVMRESTTFFKDGMRKNALGFPQRYRQSSVHAPADVREYRLLKW